MRMMRMMLAGLCGLVASACVMGPEDTPRHPYPSGQESNSGIRLPGAIDKIPDTPYEVRRAEIERDRQIAGQSGPTYPPLFRNQKDKAAGDQ